jgi:hypothetical protein
MKKLTILFTVLRIMSINAMEDILLLPMQQELSFGSVINNIEETKKSIIDWKFRNTPHILKEQLTSLTNVKTSLEKKIVDNDQSKEIGDELIVIKDSVFGIWAANKIEKNYFSLKNSLSDFITKGITTIDISHNTIEYLPLNTILSYASNVTKIDASYNKISAISYRHDQEPYTPVCHGKLRELNISNNNLLSFDFDTQFDATPYIEDIDLSHNPLATCIWKNTDAWITNKKYAIKNFPVINVCNTKLSKETINNLKQHCLEKNIQAYAVHGGGVGSLIGVFPGFATLLGMALNPQIGSAMGLEGINFIVYPIGLVVLMAAQVGAGTGLGYWIGQCVINKEDIIESINKTIISDYSNESSV